MENTQGMVVTNTDGYSNLLSKYGTKQDNSTAYEWSSEPFADDMMLESMYEGNGLFAKIIDIPSDEAIKHGLDIDFGDDAIKEYVDDRLDELDYEAKMALGMKWARLYGGAIGVMIVEDGGTLEQPLNFAKVKSIKDILIFERAVCEPDWIGLNQFNIEDSLRRGAKVGEPEYYHVFSMYGNFRVHVSRCLIFRNGRLPEHAQNANYRWWGMPEYVRIKKELQRCLTSHGYSTKMLERAVQAIYKMSGLSNTLSTDEGENAVIKRLELIDMARGILNSIAIDADGEDYDFKNMQLSGVKDILDATCNMLSAVTNIPQTRLFGASPAGMNSTGESDMENFYNMVEGMQKVNLKKNTKILIDIILKEGLIKHEFDDIPKYKVKFTSLWSLTELEQANVDKVKAEKRQVEASIAQTYIDAGVLDASEVRTALAKNGEFCIQEVLDEEDLNISEEDLSVKEMAEEVEKSIMRTTSRMDEDVQISQKTEANNSTQPYRKNEAQALDKAVNTLAQAVNEIQKLNEPKDSDKGVGVIVCNDGYILVAERTDGKGLCGPGGHIRIGEEPLDAAIREAQEEFGIECLTLLPLGETKASSGEYEDSKVYITDNYSGRPRADGIEMTKARWLTYEQLRKENLFPPFKQSLELLINEISGGSG